MNVFAAVTLANFAATGPYPIIVRILMGLAALSLVFWTVVGFVKLRAALEGRDIANRY